MLACGQPLAPYHCFGAGAIGVHCGSWTDLRFELMQALWRRVTPWRHGQVLDESLEREYSMSESMSSGEKQLLRERRNSKAGALTSHLESLAFSAH